MSKTYDRVLAKIHTKEPKGHCEAVNQRCLNSLKITKKKIEKDLI